MSSFFGIGLVSSAAYLATLTLSKEWFGLSVLKSAFLAFCVGTAVSYLGNTLLTFRSEVNGATFARFLVVVLVGLGLNQAIAYGLDWAGVYYVFVALTVFIVVPVVNFIGHSVFTYRGNRI